MDLNIPIKHPRRAAPAHRGRTQSEQISSETWRDSDLQRMCFGVEERPSAADAGATPSETGCHEEARSFLAMPPGPVPRQNRLPAPRGLPESARRPLLKRQPQPHGMCPHNLHSSLVGMDRERYMACIP